MTTASRRALRLRSFYAAGKRLARASVGLIYPPQCAYCTIASAELREAPFCEDCLRQLAPAGLPQCRRCAAVVNAFEQGEKDCSYCRKERFKFAHALALARYEGPPRDAVLRMKRSSEEPLMMAMGRLLAERFADEIHAFRPDVVVPIPMHWTRRAVRGTNSAEVIGDVLARQLRLLFAPRALLRKRRTRKLAELTRQERKRTLRNAFCIARGCDFAGARVLLVDDVLTTGATCDTAARALKNGGAAEIAVLVAARAQPPD